MWRAGASTQNRARPVTTGPAVAIACFVVCLVRQVASLGYTSVHMSTESTGPSAFVRPDAQFRLPRSLVEPAPTSSPTSLLVRTYSDGSYRIPKRPLDVVNREILVNHVLRQAEDTRKQEERARFTLGTEYARLMGERDKAAQTPIPPVGRRARRASFC